MHEPTLHPEDLRRIAALPLGHRPRRDALDEAGASDRAARDEMFRLTRQSRAPSITVDGHVLADFGTDELEAFLRQHGYL